MNHYTGFYIDRPLGNNVFSYEERKNKSIYVPKLIEGTLCDVKIGEKVVFNEIDDDGNEIKAKGLENIVEWDTCDGKKVYIFDNHNHAFYFWNDALHQNLFNKGCTLVHVDQHKDTRVPENYDVNTDDMDDVFRYTNEVLNVGSFIKPAMEKKIFSELIIMDSTYSLKENVSGEYVLDIDLDIFSTDMDYIPFADRFDRIQELIKGASVITIATSPYFIEQDKAIKVLKELFSYDII